MSAKKGDTVSVHYTGTFPDGTVFDSSVERNEPIQFTVGAGQMIAGFDQAVEGMTLNEEKEISLQPEEAYGASREDLIFEVPKTQFPPNISPEEGQQLMMRANEQDIQVLVTKVAEESVTLDANHPMAGKALNFSIKLVEIH